MSTAYLFHELRQPRPVTTKFGRGMLVAWMKQSSGDNMIHCVILDRGGIWIEVPSPDLRFDASYTESRTGDPAFKSDHPLPWEPTVKASSPTPRPAASPTARAFFDDRPLTPDTGNTK